MKPAYLILLLVMNFFWAAVYSSYKIIGQDLPAGGIVTLRFGLAALCFLLMWPWLPGAAPRGRDLALTCFLGLMLYVVGHRLQVYGNQLGTAGNSSILMAFEPLVTSVLAALILHEHIGPRRIAGFIMGLAGVAMLHGIRRADYQWAGLAASAIFLSSFICEAAYSVGGKTLVARNGIMKMLTLSLVAGSLGNLLIDGPATMHAARVLPLRAWVLLGLMAVVCTVIGYTVWFVVIRDCPVNVAALTVFSQAVFGVVIAVVWLGEEVRPGQVLGCLTIVAGLVLGLSRQVKTDDQAARPGAAT